jgi:AraC-like DNA-binding protein
MGDNDRFENAKVKWQHPAELFTEYQFVPRRVTAMSLDQATGDYIEPHKHPRGQLLYASSGLMRAATEDGIWFIPPQRGLWIPAGIVHDQLMLSPVKMRTVYIERSLDVKLGDRCRVIEVHTLLRELITALAAEPIEYELEGRNSLIVGLMLEEIARSRTVPLEIPWPKDKRIVSICEAILETPGTALTMAHWADSAGASERTLIRLFLKETGLSYRQWIQQARLAAALTQLEQGGAVAEVSNNLGYSSASAFTVMFRRVLGETPTDYLSRRQR